MKFSYNWLKELYPKLGTPQQAADQLTFHSFTVENIEPRGKDFVFDIDSQSLGRRAADAVGHIGIARELAVIGGGSFSPLKISLKESLPKASDFLALTIARNAAAPRHSGRLMFEVENKESPSWMRERLIACGLRSINLIVDVTNYVMLEVGQPLHAFDYDKLAKPRKNSKAVVDIRFAKAGETLDILGESRKYPLTINDLVLADADGSLDIAGIKGGKRSEVSKTTKRIFLSAASFDGPAIRQTSKRLGLRTDASWRFERGMDANGTIYALDRAAELIQKFGGGKVLRGIVDAYPKRSLLRSIPLRIDRVSSLLGIAIPEAVGVGILQRLGCDTKKLSKGAYRVMPPSWRLDLTIEEDLIEEIGRIWGYERIKPEMPVIRGGVPAKNDQQIFEDEIKVRLAGYGFTESHPSSFIGKKELALFDAKPWGLYELENPTSPDAAYLTAIPAMKYVRSIAENLRNFDSVRIFGIARAFFKTGKGPVERRRLIIALAKKGKDGKEEFYALKGTTDALLESFGVSNHWYDDEIDYKLQATSYKLFHPYRFAEVKIGDEKIGVMGEISQKIQEALKARSRIVIAEFDVDELLGQIEAEQEFRPIARFPSVVRDIALLVPEEARIQDVENVIANAAKLLADMDLFDIYEGKNMPKDVKSVAFHLVFQSDERTLTDEEVNKEFQKVLKAVQDKGWEVRK